MSATTDPDVNKGFQPTDTQERVLDVFKRGRGEGAWGVVNPLYIRMVTGLRKQRVNEILGSLDDAGWVEPVTHEGNRVRGLYRFVGDPREESADA